MGKIFTFLLARDLHCRVFLLLALHSSLFGLDGFSSRRAEAEENLDTQATVSLALPMDISDQNTSATFQVDSTWVMVHGKTKGLSGKVFLGDPADIRTMQGEILFPVSSFDTDNSRRDDHLREVMSVDRFPLVRFKVTSLAMSEGDVNKMRTMKPGDFCSGVVHGELTITNVSKPLEIPLRIVRKDAVFEAQGKHSLQWAEYNVEDPSFLLAKLHKTVSVEFVIQILSK